MSMLLTDHDKSVLEELIPKLQEPTLNLQKTGQLLPLMTRLKVLSRKPAIRQSLSCSEISAMIAHIMNSGNSTETAAEGANVLLNICYEKDNVNTVLKCGGANALVQFLTSEDRYLQANAAGALQSICFQPEGRHVVRNLGAIPLLVKLLEVQSMNVRARAVGALHNISSDVDAIRPIRRTGGIAPLIKLLASTHPCIFGSAAGALQNLSREIVSRRIIRESEAISLLIAMLSCCEVQAQVCAAGALLNVVVTEMSEQSQSPSPSTSSEQQRRALVRTITAALVGSLIYETCFGEEARNLFHRSHAI